ncbi:MBL fold metallo-hydrolase [Flavihumibacter fluvii]|uniref:MBL fold metallo-hydrolase n=1 Tax=Flavihumibacter fluvii TaxID=2838157 RepID=UPI001BDF050F|nr:MBL fold metallo-hydrolase [Flavihumibacter fluvii]ULQ52707.1 MBL fold metallo-hydrolase [Flavihumibacter fluvii]
MQLHLLEVRFDFGAGENIIYPVVMGNPGQFILVDCGYTGFLPKIEAALQQCSISAGQLHGVLVTHHDMDHVGGLHELVTAYPHLKIYSSATEEKYINGVEKSLRLIQAEELFPTFPEDQKPGAIWFQELLKKVKPVKVDHTFPAESETYLLPGAKIISTPGHTPGHISIYLEDTKTLIAADALVFENGELEIANPAFTLDLTMAVNSVKKISELDIHKIICYHGGVVETNIMPSLKKLIAKYS